MRIFAINLDLAERFWKDEYFLYISLDKQQRCSRFRFSQDKMRALYGEMLIRVGSAKIWGLESLEWEINRNQEGKPFFERKDGCHFNLSHSGSWIIAVFDCLSVGIDIEQIRDIDLEMSNRFLSHSEIYQLKSMSREDQLKSFYRFWTLKESYVKAVGKGLYMPLDAVSFQLHDETVVYKEKNEIENVKWFFSEYDLDEDYKLSVCASQNEFPNQIQVIHCKCVIDEFLKLHRYTNVIT